MRRTVEYDVAGNGTVLTTEESVPYASVPAAVRAAAEKYFGSAAGLKASREVENGKTFYEVEGSKKGNAVTLKLTDAGPNCGRGEGVNNRGVPCLTEPTDSVCSDPGSTAQTRSTLLLLLTAVFLLFWGLGWRSLWAAEGRWAQVTREMLLTGDFFHPTIGGEPYFDKPLLTYWLRAAISVLTGVLNELVVRLPSAIAGMVGRLGDDEDSGPVCGRPRQGESPAGSC